MVEYVEVIGEKHKRSTESFPFLVRSRVVVYSLRVYYADQIVRSPCDPSQSHRKPTEVKNGYNPLQTAYLAVRASDLWEDAHNRANQVKEPHGGNKNR